MALRDMGRRTLVELLHLAAGVAITALVFAGAAWAYPQGGETLRWVGLATMVVVVAMSIAPLRLAFAADRGAR